MSGIVGFLGLDGRPARAEELERMVETLAHRGPDGRAIWVEGAAGLGHCMLHTTPESLNEHLPFQRDGLVITADARIDNREELIDSLQLKTQQPEQISDSELIFYAYQHWGEDCPAKLLGDFAFAIWDTTKQQLFCARDHFGVKPFHYYYQFGQRFVFATEIKAIFSYGDIPKQLNENKICDYMLGMFEDKTRTFYVDINRMPPASVMVVGKDGIRQRQYWALDPKQEIRMKSDAEYAEAYRSLFIEAVRCRLRSAFPIGSMLSGGLDSSSITCVAKELLATNKEQDLHTFSIIFNEIKKSDEREYIYKALENKEIIAHFIEGDHATPFDNLDKILWFQDEPFYAPNLFLNWLAWQAAKENRVRILLDGFLGDNVVSHGIGYLNELASHWRWISLAKQIKQYIHNSKQDVPLIRPMSMYFLQHGIKPYIPEAALILWRKLRGNQTNPIAKEFYVFESKYSKRIALQERLLSAYQYNRLAKPARNVHYDDLNCGMIQTALEICNKGCSNFHLELRIPYIDKRVVEFCLAIPGHQKINEGYTRIIMRRALRGLLPEEIRWRSDKGNLSWSFLSGIKQAQNLVHKSIISPDCFLSNFFNLEYLNDIRNLYNKGKMVDKEAMSLFLIVVLSTWQAQICHAYGKDYLAP